jgi:hypothetical protein
MKQRRIQNQQQFVPTNSYSSMQEQPQPVVADQQNSQSLEQKPTSKKIYFAKKQN